MKKTRYNNFNLMHPNLSVFTNMINNNNYFSITKYSIEWWIALKKALDLFENYDVKNDKEFKNLSKKVFEVWVNDQLKGRGWYISEEIINKTIKNMNYYDKDLFFGVGFCGSFSGKKIGNDFIQNKTKHLYYIFECMEKLKLKNKILYNTSFWKYWAYSGELNVFFDYIKNKNIVVVGPEHLKNFGNILNLPKFHHIEIDTLNAIKYIEKYENEIIDFSKNNTGCIYIMQGGGASIYMLPRLYKKIKNSFIFDVGTAIDVYYFEKFSKYGDDYIKNPLRWMPNKPKWM